MVGMAKGIFDSMASMYEQKIKSKQDFSNKQEELIKQGFKDLNIPESEQQALMEKYSPRFQKDYTSGESLSDMEKKAQKALEEGREPFQKNYGEVYLRCNSNQSYIYRSDSTRYGIYGRFFM